ncbi:MAG: hypothetical protein J6B93_05135 [Clostridia bacterium]|nr:hypothetical protein [Clostridia bacterium]
MKRLKVIIALALALSITGISAAAYTVYKEIGHNPGDFNVCAFGAVPNDGKDDTAAFMAMGQAAKTIYIPAGEFEVTETIELLDSSLIGAGAEKSVIVCKTKTDREPIVEAGGRCVIRDITLMYDESCIKGNELAGERVGIYTGQMEKTLKRGTSISNLHIKNVGTGIYSPKTDIDKFKMEAVSFSVTYESVRVTDFIYRGIDMANETRTGNIYRNIYISTNGKEADAGFFLQTRETECEITGLTVENSKLKTPVKFEYCEALSATNINFIDVQLTKDNTGLLYVDKSNVLLDSLNFYNCQPKGALRSFVRLGDNMYRGAGWDSMGSLHIGDLNVINPDITEGPDAGQYFFARKAGFVNAFKVTVDRYNLVAPDSIKAQYEKFSASDREIDLTIGGKK